MQESVETISEGSWSFQKTMAPAIAGVKKNWIPFLAIQLTAALIAMAYYNLPLFAKSTQGLIDLKLRGGLVFAFFAGMIAGGVIPEIAKAVTGQQTRFDRAWLMKTLFNGFVYGVIGVQVFFFYDLQSKWFGDGTDIKTLTIKTFVDMGLFSPLLSIPTATILFEWQKAGFSSSKLTSVFKSNFYRDKILPGLFPCWCFWIPVLYSVYAMPPNLQFCLAILAEAAWSILFVFIMFHEDEPELKEELA